MKFLQPNSAALYYRYLIAMKRKSPAPEKSLFFAAKIEELDKIKVGAVSYLNTKPLLYGIKRDPELLEQLELWEEFPAKIAAMLLDGSIDVGLVPVRIIPMLKESYIISDYCIGSDGEVASVGLFSEVALHEIETVLLDYQSRTSVELCKVLCKHHWKIDPAFEDGGINFIQHIRGKTAGVVIGDRALKLRESMPYEFDLAAAWKEMTGLPFVFAAWVANKKLPEDFISHFNKANAEGIVQLDAVIAENSYSHYDLQVYYRRNISYLLDENKRDGLKKFLELVETVD